jgi:hypothetical protein
MFESDVDTGDVDECGDWQSIDELSPFFSASELLLLMAVVGVRSFLLTL